MGYKEYKDALIQLFPGVPSSQVISECVPNLLKPNLKSTSQDFLSEMDKIPLATESADHIKPFPPCALQGQMLGVLQ